jgi:hypothetical protein
MVYVLTQVFKLTGTTLKQLTGGRREQLQRLLDEHVGDWDDLTVSAGQNNSMNIQFSTTCDPKPLLGHMTETGNQLSSVWDANLTITPGRAIRQKTIRTGAERNMPNVQNGEMQMRIRTCKKSWNQNRSAVRTSLVAWDRATSICQIASTAN